MEVKSKRDKYTKTYDIGDGAFETESSPEPIHYLEDGKWKEIDRNIKEVDDEVYPYQVTKNAIKAFFKDDPKSDKVIKLESDRGYLTHEPISMRYGNNSGETELISEVNKGGIDIDGNVFNYLDEFPNVHDEFIVNPDDVKDNLILEEMPTETSLTGEVYLEFVDIIDFEGSIVADGNVITSDYVTSNDIEIRNKRGQHVYTIPELKTFEKGKMEDYIIGEYKITFKNGECYLVSRVPLEWLTSENREFPVVVDPNTTLKAEYNTGALARVNSNNPDSNFYESVIEYLPDEDPPLNTTLTDATDYVRSVYADTDYIYVGSADNNTYIYNKSDFSLETTLTDATNVVYSVYADTDYIYVGSQDNNTYIYNKSDFTLNTTLTDSNDYVESVYADTDYVYVGSTDNNTYIYNKSDFSLNTTLTDATGQVYSVYADTDYIFVGSYDNNTYIYDKDFTLNTTLSDATNVVYSVYADTDYIYVGSWDNNTYIYNKSDFSLETTLTDATDYVLSVYADADYIYMGSADNNIYIYDHTTTAPLQTLNVSSTEKSLIQFNGLPSDTEVNKADLQLHVNDFKGQFDLILKKLQSNWDGETVTWNNVPSASEVKRISGGEFIDSYDLSVDLTQYNNVIYVDGENGDDDTGDGSESNPYATITYVINNIINNTGDAIYIKGFYDISNEVTLIIDKDIELDFIGDYQNENTTIYTNSNSGNSGRVFRFETSYDSILRFYNIKFFSESTDYGEFFDGYAGSYEYKSHVYLYNCVFDSQTARRASFLYLKTFHAENTLFLLPSYSNQDYLKNAEYINCAYNNLHTDTDTIITTCLEISKSDIDSDYNITSSGWQNTGTGENPDETQANIGVYGGEYAWGDWIKNLYPWWNIDITSLVEDWITGENYGFLLETDNAGQDDYIKFDVR